MSSAAQVEPGLPRPVARQPPRGDESDQVHDAVPMDAQRSEPEYRADRDGDGIDVRIGQHASTLNCR